MYLPPLFATLLRPNADYLKLEWLTYFYLYGKRMSRPNTEPGTPSSCLVTGFRVLHDQGTSTSTAIARRSSPRVFSPVVRALLASPTHAMPVSRLDEAQPIINQRGNPKTHETIIASRNQDLPTNWPRGPWTDHFVARDAFNTHFNPGFGVTLDSKKVGTKKSGQKVFLLCHRHGIMRKSTSTNTRVRGGEGVNCKWKITLEESIEGWVVSKINNLEHTHDLVTTRAESLAHASLRKIPDDLITFGLFLKQAGMGPADILKYVQFEVMFSIVILYCYHCLASNVYARSFDLNACHSLFNEVAIQSDRAITWNYDDVYNKFKVSAEDRKMDATRFCDWLKEMDTHGMPSFIDVSKFGQLKSAAFTVPGALEWWAINKDYISIHYDTTFGTNRSGMKLGLITVVDGDGHTRILFVTLVAHQDAQSFEWVFRKMMLVFKIAPKVIFTDSDAAMAAAIWNIFGAHVVHLLCTWHLSLNLATNLKGVAGNKFSIIDKMFWGICKETDLLSRDTFDAEFKQLTSIVPTPDSTDSRSCAAYNKAMLWLKSLYDRRKNWAARWTWQYYSAGIAFTNNSSLNNSRGCISSHLL